MAYQIGDIVKYAIGTPANPEFVEAKVFAKFGNKISIDHRTFAKARTVSIDSAKLFGKVS